MKKRKQFEGWEEFEMNWHGNRTCRNHFIGNLHNTEPSISREAEDLQFEVHTNQPPSELYLNVWDIGNLNLRQVR